MSLSLQLRLFRCSPVLPPSFCRNSSSCSSIVLAGAAPRLIRSGVGEGGTAASEALGTLTSAEHSLAQPGIQLTAPSQAQ